MTFAQLLYAIEVARHGSINKAAHSIYVTQSSVSSAIKELENELGTTLFIRDRKGIALTTEGRVFISYARALVENKKQLEHLFSSKVYQMKSLSISCARYAFAVEAFVRLINSYNTDCFEYRINEKGLFDIINDVDLNKCDLGIIYLSESTQKHMKKIMAAKNIEYHDLACFVPHVYIRAGHPLAPLENVALEDLKPYPYVAFSGDSNDYAEEINLFAFSKPMGTIFVQDRAATYSVITNTDSFTIGSGALAYDLTGSMLITKQIIDIHDKMLLGWIKKQGKDNTEEMQKFISILHRVCLDKQTGIAEEI